LPGGYKKPYFYQIFRFIGVTLFLSLALLGGWSEEKIPSSYRETLAYLQQLAEKSPQVKLFFYGKSELGKDLPAVLISQMPLSSPQEAQNCRKLIVLITAQVHGNEPAGKDAALSLAGELALGRLHPLLDNLIIIICPVLNPDGAEFNQRLVTLNLDPNRDYFKLEVPEIKALVEKIIGPYQPHLVLDLHETAFRPGLDFMFESASGVCPSTEINRITEEQLLAPMQNFLQTRGGRLARYSRRKEAETTADSSNDRVNMQSARNYHGLALRVSILLETVLPQDPNLDLQSRIAIQLLALENLLTNASNLKDEIKARVEDARLASWQTSVPVSPAQYYINHPYAYILPPQLSKVAELLKIHSIKVEKTASPMELEVEAFQLSKVEVARQLNQGHFTLKIKTQLKTKKLIFPAGSFVITTSQPYGRIVTLMLEPLSPDGIINYGLLDSFLRQDKILPVYRLTMPLKMPADFLQN